MNHQAVYIIIKAKRGHVQGILYLMVVGWRSLSPCTSRGRGQERIGLNYVGHCLCSIPLTVAQAKLGTVWGRPQIYIAFRCATGVKKSCRFLSDRSLIEGSSA